MSDKSWVDYVESRWRRVKGLKSGFATKCARIAKVFTHDVGDRVRKWRFRIKVTDVKFESGNNGEENGEDDRLAAKRIFKTINLFVRECVSRFR